MLCTNDKSVYRLSRSIVMHLIRPLLQSRFVDEQSRMYIDLEASWWLDSLSSETLKPFCETLDYMSENSLAALGNFSEVITDSSSLHGLHLSMFAMVSLAMANNENPAFFTMILQVVIRCLLVQRNPSAIAKFLIAVGKSGVGPLTTRGGEALLRYAEALANFDGKGSACRTILKDVFAKCYAEDHVPSRYLRGSEASKRTTKLGLQGAYENCRFALHSQLIGGSDDSQGATSVTILSQAVPHLFMVCFLSMTSAWTRFSLTFGWCNRVETVKNNC